MNLAGDRGMSERLMLPVEVARRWRMHEKTLAQWRWKGKGPAYVKLGRRVFYRREEIERFEAAWLDADRTRGPLRPPIGGVESPAPTPNE
jgi:hypothetical protein